MRHLLGNLLGNKKGQGLVEYGLIIAGVALICAVSVSIFGHKTNDLIAAVATVIPCAHADDAAPITSGKLIETTVAASGALELDVQGIAAASDTGRLGNNVLSTDPTTDGFGGLIVE